MMHLEPKFQMPLFSFADLLLRPDIYTMDDRAVVSQNKANAASRYAITSLFNSCWALINLRGVLVKLLSFSVSLGAVPLISYYVSLTYFYKGMISWVFFYPFHLRNRLGNSTLAAIVAVVAANLVLITYIITSLLEDREDRLKKDESESKKTR